MTTSFREMYGAVYIFENAEARRVKIGVTIGRVEDRLLDINRKWAGINGTCQICGERRLLENQGSPFPSHTYLSSACPGTSSPPLDSDTTLAQSYLKTMKKQIIGSSGSEKNSLKRRINSLEKRISKFDGQKIPIGEWHLKVAYYTNYAEVIELQAHEFLAKQLDEQAKIGEVFCCSVSEAEMAIESLLYKKNLLDSAKKEIW